MAIREARVSDIPAILALIKDLAEYEKALAEVCASESDLERAFFGERAQVFALVATENEIVVGIAIWHLNFSTWLGKHGLYLEDLYVIPQARGMGHGIALLQELAKICLERGYERFQWWVLDWNESAIEFYKSLGAVAMDEWSTFRLTSPDIKRLAQPISQ